MHTQLANIAQAQSVSKEQTILVYMHIILIVSQKPPKQRRIDR